MTVALLFAGALALIFIAAFIFGWATAPTGRPTEPSPPDDRAKLRFHRATWPATERGYVVSGDIDADRGPDALVRIHILDPTLPSSVVAAFEGDGSEAWLAEVREALKALPKASGRMVRATAVRGRP